MRTLLVHARLEGGSVELFDALKQEARSHCDTIAVRCGSQSISFRELEDWSSRVASWLRVHSQSFTCIACWATGSIHHVILMFACLKSGIPFINLDTDAPVSYLEELLHRVQAQKIYFDTMVPPNLGHGFSVTPMKKILSDCQQATMDIPLETAVPHGIGYYVTTSGSTGRPKIVAKSYGRLNESFLQIRETLPWLFHETIEQCAPLCYAFGLDQTLLLLCGGATICIPQKRFFDLEQQYASVSTHQAGVVFWGAPVIHLLSRAPLLLDRLPTCLRAMVSGGAPMHVSANFIMALRARDVTLINNYGSTETGTICFSPIQWSLEEIGEQNLVPVGNPLPGFAFCLDGKEQDAPESGRVWVKMQELDQTYLDDADAFQHKVRRSADGKCILYDTGDMGRKRNQQYEILGRSDNVVNIKGCRVSLEMVDHLLQEQVPEHACCVICMEEPKGGAFLVGVIESDAAAGGHLAAKDLMIRKAMEERVPAYMVPDIIYAWPTFPRLRNQKIDRKALREVIQMLTESEKRIPKDMEAFVKMRAEAILHHPLPDAYPMISIQSAGFDSLGFADFVSTLEAAFSISIDDRRIIRKEITTFYELLCDMKRKVEEKHEG